MDVFKIVTDRIIEELNHGVIPWHKPWLTINGGAFNRVTGRKYSLLNQLMLKHSGEYATFSQWMKLGGRIRKGEKSEFVVFWKWIDEGSTPENINEADLSDPPKCIKAKEYPMLRYYRVFHISQIDGVAPITQEESFFKNRTIIPADSLLRDYINREGIKLIKEISDEAYYSPLSDLIHLPDIAQYEHVEEFYSTAFHEAVHSTGHISRLNRFKNIKVSFGSEMYSKEELVAEIGSASLMTMIGIDTEYSFRNSAAYIQNWMSVLRSDRKLIVSAASQAEKAVTFIAADNICCQ